MASTVRTRARDRAKIARTMRKIHEAGSEQAKRICEFAVDEIRSNPATPYDETRRADRQLTPHLRNSYEVRPHPIYNGWWVIVTDVRYWAFVEFGTYKDEAQPHLRPAIEYARGVFG